MALMLVATDPIHQTLTQIKNALFLSITMYLMTLGLSMGLALERWECLGTRHKYQSFIVFLYHTKINCLLTYGSEILICTHQCHVSEAGFDIPWEFC